MHIRFFATTVAVSALAFPASLFAANAAFQDFFFDVCNSPTGALQTRCNETDAGAGDLSGDSESSLNPSQGLSVNSSALNIAQTRSKENRERGDRLRDDEELAEEVPGAASFGPFSLFVHGRGEWFDTERTPDVDAERGLDGDILAVELGFDYRLADRIILGSIVTYEDSTTDFDAERPGVNFTPASTAGEIEGDTFTLQLFGLYNIGDRAYAEASLGYGFTDYAIARNSVFQESGRTVPQTNVRVTGDTDGNEYWGSLNFGYDFGRGAFTLGTYAGITYANSDIDGYTESDLTGSGLNMRVDDNDRDSLLGHVGLRGSWALSTASGVWIPQLRAEWNHEFEDDRQDLATSFVLDAGNTLYALSGDKPDQDFFNLAVGIVGILANGWIPFIDLETLAGHDTLDRTRLTLGLRKEF